MRAGSLVFLLCCSTSEWKQATTATRKNESVNAFGWNQNHTYEYTDRFAFGRVEYERALSHSFCVCFLFLSTKTGFFSKRFFSLFVIVFLFLYVLFYTHETWRDFFIQFDFKSVFFYIYFPSSYLHWLVCVFWSTKQRSSIQMKKLKWNTKRNVSRLPISQTYFVVFFVRFFCYHSCFVITKIWYRVALDCSVGECMHLNENHDGK